MDLKPSNSSFQDGSEGARRVLFQTQPDVLLLSLPREHSQKEDALARAEEVQSDEERLHSSDSSSGRRRGYRSRRWGAEESVYLNDENELMESFMCLHLRSIKSH